MKVWNCYNRKKDQKNQSTFQKLVIMGGLVFFVLLAAFLSTWRYLGRAVQESLRQARESLMEQMVGKFASYHQNIVQVATSMAYSPTVYACFFQDSAERVISNDEVSVVFSNTFLLDNSIEDIFLYDREREQIAGAGKELEELEGLAFLEEWKERTAYSGLFAMPGTNAPCYALYFPVFDLESEKYADQIGMCVLVIRAARLAEILTEAQRMPGGELYLADAGGQILAASGEMGRQSPEEGKDGAQRTAQAIAIGGFSLVYEGTEAALSQEVARNIGFIAAAYLLAALLVLWLLYICYRSMVRPIQEMDAFVQAVMSDPSLRIEVREQNEIGKVGQGLNLMLDSIARKNAEIQEMKEWAYQAELAKKQLQILAYRNQIHPHFLYNTLDCVRAMAVLNGQKPIAAIAMALSRMFRFAVKEENVVTVEEEVSYIEEYARIIDFRFDGKIKIEVEVGEGVFSKPILKMILQPLIENAVFHGLERQVGGGRVEASVCMAGEGRLRLEVADDGCGMPAEALARLRASLSEGQGEDNSGAEGSWKAGGMPREQGTGGIGLPNIYHRLQLFYGEGMEFSIESREREGTTVMIEITDDVTDGGIAHVSGFSGR